MRTPLRLTVLIALLAGTLAQAGHGQHRFWLGGGLGAGAGRLQCGICESEGVQGTSGYFRAGTTLNPRLLVGGEAALWQRSADEGKRRILAFTAGLWWYPKPPAGWFIRAGTGLSRWRAWDQGEAVTSKSLVLVVGAGYEARVGPRLLVSPFINLFGSGSGGLWLESWDEVSYERHRLPSGAHALLLQAGVGLTRR